MINTNNALASTNKGDIYICKDEDLSLNDVDLDVKIYPLSFNNYVKLNGNPIKYPSEFQIFSANSQKKLSGTGTSQLASGIYYISINRPTPIPIVIE